MTVDRGQGRLFLFDLDDTLIDRHTAFPRWAASWTRSRGLPEEARTWLLANDWDGFRPRDLVFGDLRERFGIEDPVEDLVEEFEATFAGFLEPVPEPLRSGLVGLRETGWRLGIVTNGSPAQARKVVASGLDALVDGVVISEVAGVRKPAARIFALAAEACGATLEGGWMCGDNPEADIGGGVAAGLRTAWLHHGRDWPESLAWRPDLTCGTAAEAIEGVLGTAPR